MTDPWAASLDEHDVRRRLRSERIRQTVAKLLLVRGQQRAAAIIAISALEVVSSGRWEDEGPDDGIVAVPVEIFDRVDDGSRAAIDAAVRDVVGSTQYGELRVEVQLGELVSGWDRVLLEYLRDGSSPTTAAIDLPPLPNDYS